MESLIFNGCTSLTTVTCSSNLGATAFNGCTALTDVTFTEDVTIIPQGVFQNCSALKSIKIPSSVTTIELQAFSGCSSLTNVTLTEGLESIGASAFAKCSNLKSIAIPSSVKEIGTSVFRQCDALNAVYVDLKSWCTINIDYGSVAPEVWYEFLYLNNVKATEITDLIIPEGVTKLSDNVFKSWKNLKSVTFPASMTDFSSLNFEKCNSLNAIHIKDLTVWLGTKFNIIAPYYKYNPLYYAKHLYMDGQEVTNLVIPEDVSAISSFAFKNCEGLTSINIGNTVTTIGEYAFANCTNVRTITIGSAVKSIEKYNFYGCKDLQTVYSLIEEPFPLSGQFQFYTPNETNDGTVFTSATLYVPVGTKSKYEVTAGWKKFKNIVEMVNIDPIEGETTVNTESLNGQDLSDNVVDDVYSGQRSDKLRRRGRYLRLYLRYHWQ